MHFLTLIAVFGFFGCVLCISCRKANWWSSFDREGLSSCDSNDEGIRGFWRNDKQTPDNLHYLETATCCSQAKPFRKTSNIVYVDWWWKFDNMFTWAFCPTGFFLQGIYKTGTFNSKLHNIEEGRCWKPADHPYRYGGCYDEYTSLGSKGTSECKDGYYITGLYRGGCNDLRCLSKLKCCKMAPALDVLDSLQRVKTLVMDRTLPDLSLLAHYMGYGWCGGCRSPSVGEDFRRHGDTWEADKSRRCSGFMSNHTLSIKYGHWSFAIADIKYGKPVVTSLKPEVIDSGIIRNNHGTKTSRTITRTEEISRTVTHTTTSAWKHHGELGLEISYTPPGATGGFGAKTTFKFGYEISSTTTDSENKTNKKAVTVTDTKELEPYSSAKFDLLISKTRTTVPYTATIIARFSAELQGFLRWGGGSGKPGTNYHYEHYGSEERPTFNYRFGDAKTPFYEALKYQSDTLQRPWMWGSLKSNYYGAQRLINKLCNENQYEFTLTGKFDDIAGQHMDITWGDVEHGRGKRSDPLKIYDQSVINMGTHQSIARSLPGDEPSPNPAPPKVEIKLPEDVGINRVLQMD